MAITFKLKGLRAIERRLRQLAQKVSDEAALALRGEAEAIMTTSKRDFVPVDLGPLRASGMVGTVRRKGDVLSVLLSFGGPAVRYALEQHENLEFSHKVGEAKYLEKPLLEALPGMDKRLAARIRLRGLGGGDA